MLAKLAILCGGMSLALILSILIWTLKGSKLLGLEDQFLPFFVVLGALIGAVGGATLARRFEAALIGFFVGPIMTTVIWTLVKAVWQSGTQG